MSLMGTCEVGAVDGRTRSDRGDSRKCDGCGGGCLNMCEPRASYVSSREGDGGPAGICGSTLSGASGTLYAELAAAADAPAPGGRGGGWSEKTGPDRMCLLSRLLKSSSRRCFCATVSVSYILLMFSRL